MIVRKYSLLIPNGLTFLSLLCGTASILTAAATPTAAAAPRHLWGAGLLILASYLLDWSDGAAARTLRASTAFGLQLDSLVDMVSLGLAPTVLLFMYSLRVLEVSPWLSGPVLVLVPLAGAFRLARFNLLPPKTSSNTDSLGLTISTSGALVALTVVASLSAEVRPAPLLYLGLAVLISGLMVSTIPFPALPWFFASWRTTVGLLALLGVSLLLLPFFTAWLVWTGTYVGVGLIRALARHGQ
ncbi:MAG: phosphatidylcholine/phosphatidylserine synthase [Candidatus Tectimicrobiota bacterium]